MKRISFVFLASIAFFASCDKKATLPSNNNNGTAAATPSPAPTTGDGFLVALQTVTNTTVAGFPINTVFGTGLAGFGNLAAGTYTDAGAITLNSKAMTKNANNTYTYIPSTGDITGVDLSSSINWNVGGGNGIPAFTHDATAQDLPNSGDLSAFASINSTNDFSLSVSGSISNSDSVYFQISGANGSVLKRMASNTTTALFTAAELQTIGKGTGTVVVAPWNMDSITQGGKKIYIINELALSRLVDIQ
ncbi:MAG: hypothetical protein IPJ31_07415 [Bacteroidetes bacterium]|nr:hypothetical protein [Bacteroidota bacterium]MBP6314472.1 hypothetical protein [Chitinophagaceae bacterium]